MEAKQFRQIGALPAHSLLHVAGALRHCRPICTTARSLWVPQLSSPSCHSPEIQELSRSTLRACRSARAQLWQRSRSSRVRHQCSGGQPSLAYGIVQSEQRYFRTQEIASGGFRKKLLRFDRVDPRERQVPGHIAVALVCLTRPGSHRETTVSLLLRFLAAGAKCLA